MPNITVREFTTDDLDAVYKLIRYVVDTSYKDVYPEEALKMYRQYHSPENILNDAESGYCVVVEKENEIVGTGMLSDINIRRVYIDPAIQGAGIGSKVYEALEAQAIRNKIPRLELGASLIAKGFWEKRGFVLDKEESIPAGDEELKFYLMSKYFPVDEPEDR